MNEANLAQQLADLSVAERIQLIDDLWDSVANDPEALTLSAAQTKKLERRQEASAKKQVNTRLCIEPEAEADIEQAFAWNESQRVGLGDAFLLSLEAVLAAVHRSPETFPFVEHSYDARSCAEFPLASSLQSKWNQRSSLACFTPNEIQPNGSSVACDERVPP